MPILGKLSLTSSLNNFSKVAANGYPHFLKKFQKAVLNPFCWLFVLSFALQICKTTSRYAHETGDIVF
jgi:hypothetical protein